MFSHVMLGCSDRERSKKFYDATLGALGIKPATDFGTSDWWMTRGGALGVGRRLRGRWLSSHASMSRFLKRH